MGDVQPSPLSHEEVSNTKTTILASDPIIAGMQQANELLKTQVLCHFYNFLPTKFLSSKSKKKL